MAIKQIFHCEALTGGVDSTYLDYADGNSLSDKDRAFAIVSGVVYLYELNATSGAAESSPNVISPDTNAGTKRWILIGQNLAGLTFTAAAVGFTIAGGTTSKTLTVTADTSLDEAVAMSSKAPKASPTFTTQITTPIVYGGSAANDDITIEGTSHATKATSYVILQPTSGNVGIGTTNPGAKLEIAGLANQLRLSDANNPSANYYDIVRNASTGYLDFQGSQATYNGFLFKNNSAATILYLDPTQKVGIGKAPVANLDVAGTAAINGNTSLLGNITGGAGSTLFYDSANLQLRVGNNPSSGLFFNGQGEFQARRESANATIRIVTVGTGNNSYLAFDRARGTIASPTGIKSGDVVGSIVGVGYDGVSAAMTHGPQITLSTTEDWDATHNGNRIDFYTIANGTTNQVNTLALNQGNVSMAGNLTVSGSGNTTINGNVGIGTTAPASPLAVNRQSDDGVVIDIEQADTVEGTISVSGTTVSYNAFVGSHYTQLKDGQTEPPVGAVVISLGEIIPCEVTIEKDETTEEEIRKEDAFEEVVTEAKPEVKEEKYVLNGKDIVTAEVVSSPAIEAKTEQKLKAGVTFDEKTGTFRKSTTVKVPVSKDVSSKEYFTYVDSTVKPADKRVYGTWFGKMSNDAKGQSFGQDAKAIYLVAQVGLFKIRVTDTNGDIENGDYLETSKRPYEAQKQTVGAKINSTIAKAIIDVKWVNVPVDKKLGYKWRLIPCVF